MAKTSFAFAKLLAKEEGSLGGWAARLSRVYLVKLEDVFHHFENPFTNSPDYWQKKGSGRFFITLPLLHQLCVFARQSFESALLHFSLLVAPKGESLLVIGATSVQRRLRFCSLLK